MPSSLQTPIVLASSSPRRRALLESLGVPFEVDPPDPEAEAEASSGAPQGDPGELVLHLAEVKARAVAHRRAPGEWVVGADTVVWVQGRVLGKPADPLEALEMLRALSGQVHEVLTGVALLQVGGGPAWTGLERTSVKFRSLEAWEIEAYLGSGEPMGKAGGYAIQGLGALLVEGISGDYPNVVGLPLVRLRALLQQAGLELLTPPFAGGAVEVRAGSA